MAKQPAKTIKKKKPEWYQTWPVTAVAVVGALFLAYSAALLAIDTASMYAYAAALIFVVLVVHNLVLTIKTIRKK